ncbi:hypothetical protein C8Q73DRAFT_199127 [Cubamyces lactineus]|nr:hypothetical protein C8Q73DRAFT_199127 [Cubamyces lactineus]
MSEGPSIPGGLPRRPLPTPPTRGSTPHEDRVRIEIIPHGSSEVHVHVSGRIPVVLGSSSGHTASSQRASGPNAADTHIDNASDAQAPQADASVQAAQTNTNVPAGSGIENVPPQTVTNPPTMAGPSFLRPSWRGPRPIRQPSPEYPPMYNVDVTETIPHFDPHHRVATPARGILRRSGGTRQSSCVVTLRRLMRCPCSGSQPIGQSECTVRR